MKTAVILFNLGGPDSLEGVRPFLFSMFRDKAILRLPQPFRFALAWWIAARRAPVAREIYARLGGGSPIVKETQAQATALEARLGEGYRVFMCMRYAAPRAKEVAREVIAYAPERVILLPLYPQFSTTTTASSFREWNELRLAFPVATVESYPTQPSFIAAHAQLLGEALKRLPDARVLFSAHGLPQAIVDAGDPYPEQVKESVEAIVAALPAQPDYVICYQSRVGRLKWLSPSTDEEIRRAGAEGKSLIVVPVAFVSEHSETLVELDIEYAALARESGVLHYARVPALGLHPLFIEALAALCKEAVHA